MDTVMQAYIAGLLVGFLTFVTLRTIWKCFTEEQEGEIYHD